MHNREITLNSENIKKSIGCKDQMLFLLFCYFKRMSKLKKKKKCLRNQNEKARFETFND